jgi:hypothetical protein
MGSASPRLCAFALYSPPCLRVSTSPRLCVSASPRLCVIFPSASPRLRVSASPCLRVSASLRLRVSVSPRLRVSVSPRLCGNRLRAFPPPGLSNQPAEASTSPRNPLSLSSVPRRFRPDCFARAWCTPERNIRDEARWVTASSIKRC